MMNGGGAQASGISGSENFACGNSKEREATISLRFKILFIVSFSGNFFRSQVFCEHFLDVFNSLTDYLFFYVCFIHSTV